MPSFPDFLLEALVNAAHIDGHAADAEIDAIVAAISKAKGAEMPRAEVETAVARATLTRADLTAHLAKQGQRFSREEKMTLLGDMLAVIAADGRFEEAERAALMAYIEAIGFGGAQAPRILEAVLQPFRNAV